MLTRRTEGGPLRHCRFPTPPDNVCPKPTFVWGDKAKPSVSIHELAALLWRPRP